MSNSKLATYTRWSPNCTKPRNGRVVAISIHCTAGSEKHTARQVIDGSRFVNYNASKGASCHYAIGGDGSVAQGVDEANRAWCTSGPIDHWVVTIEVASNIDGTVVTQAAYAKLLDLCVDICQRNGIKRLLWDYSADTKALLQKAMEGYRKSSANTAYKDGKAWWEHCNLVPHRYFAAKACPGEWLWLRYEAIADAVNLRLATKSEQTKLDLHEVKEEEPMTGEEILKALTDEQAYELLTKAERHARTIPAPEWSQKDGSWADAKALGITDGTNPAVYATRVEVAAMVLRGKKEESPEEATVCTP